MRLLTHLRLDHFVQARVTREDYRDFQVKPLNEKLSIAIVMATIEHNVSMMRFCQQQIDKLAREN